MVNTVLCSSMAGEIETAGMGRWGSWARGVVGCCGRGGRGCVDAVIREKERMPNCRAVSEKLKKREDRRSTGYVEQKV